MSIELIQDRNVIVSAEGEIDLSNVAEFTQALHEAVEKAPKGFIVDFSDATYIDSAGVQAILNVSSRIDPEKGCLALVVGNDRIKSVLEVVHLEQMPCISILERLDAARQVLTPSQKSLWE